jgi:dTDP-glucose 4,6-dehydratase
MKKILITGSEGFIGSHLTELLIKRGYKVRAFIMYNSFNSLGWLDDINPDINSKIEFYFGIEFGQMIFNNCILFNAI